MPKGYTDKTSIENYTLKTIDASFDSQINSWIEAMENYIDKFTGRSFVETAEDTERLYNGNGDDDMRFDEFIELTKLEIDDVEINESDYYLEPVNQSNKNTIILKNTVFSRGRQNVKLTGKFCFCATVPADIKLAASILVSGIIGFAADLTGNITSQQVGQYRVSFSTDKGWNDFARVKEILNSYKKFSF